MQDGGCVWYVFIIREAVKQSNLLPPCQAKMRRKKENVGWQWLWRVISSRGKPRSQWVWPTAARLEPAKPGEDLPGEKEAEGGEKLSQRGRFLIVSFISTAGSVAAAGPRVLLSAAGPLTYDPHRCPLARSPKHPTQSSRVTLNLLRPRTSYPNQKALLRGIHSITVVTERR